MVDKELIGIWRNMIKPTISSLLLKTNYEGMGKQDKEEFERDFDEILDLALIELKHKEQFSQEGTTKDATSDTISRQAAIDEEIRCAICRNQTKTDRGCDGNCQVDENLHKEIIRIIEKHLPPAQPVATDTNVSDTISRQAAIDAAESAYVRGMFPTPFIREVPPAQKQLTEEEVIICKMYLEDLGSHKTCNEYKLLMGLLDGTTTVAKSKRTFVELRAEYQHPDLCTYPEYKGKPYYSIKYIEDGECFVGFGTYKPEVLSQYLRDYFMPSVQLEKRTDKHTESHACDSNGRQVARSITGIKVLAIN